MGSNIIEYLRRTILYLLPLAEVEHLCFTVLYSGLPFSSTTRGDLHNKAVCHKGDLWARKYGQLCYITVCCVASIWHS
jgi:hypothetical protein